MTEIDASDFIYSDNTPGDEIWAAAERNAAQALCEEWNEEILYSKVLNVRWLDEAKAQALFSKYLEPKDPLKSDEILRVDWEAWVVPREFNGKFEEAIIHRVQSACIDRSSLLCGEVRTYGLGPEYNYLWSETDPFDVVSTQNVPEEAIAKLVLLARNNWRDYIGEWLDEEFIESLSQPFRDLACEIRNEKDGDGKQNN